MSTITDKKITDGQRDAVWVQHQQDRLTGTPQQNKAVFDEYSELIREHFNEAMDAIDERISTNDSDIEELKEINVSEAAESARESAEIASESAQTTQDMLGRVISINNKIYTKSWDVEQERDEFVFSAEGYTYNESDTYEVFVNGLKLSESEYTRSEDSVVLGSSISAGNTVEIIVTTNLKGKGIVDTELNDDYTLTINYDDGTSMTTESIRGEKGDKGDYVDWVTPEMFGAKGDGVTDDTYALQQTFLGGNKTIELYKDYKVTGQVNVFSNTKVIGKGAIYDCRTGSFENYSGLFHGASCENVVFENVRILGDGAGNEVPYKIDLYFEHAKNISVIHCEIKDTDSIWAILFNRCNHSFVESCYIENYSYGGVGNVNGGNDFSVSNCTILNASTSNANSYGIMLNGYDYVLQEDTFGGVGLSAINNYLYDENPTWEMIDAHGGTDITVIGNRLENSCGGISVFNDSVRRFYTKNVIVKDNVINCSDEATITNNSSLVVGGDNVVVSGNIVNNGGICTSGSTGNGAVVIRQVTDGIVSNNVIINSYVIGMRLVNLRNVDVSNNSIINVESHNNGTTYGMSFDNGYYENVIIENNNIKKCDYGILTPSAFTTLSPYLKYQKNTFDEISTLRFYLRKVAGTIPQYDDSIPSWSTTAREGDEVLSSTPANTEQNGWIYTGTAWIPFGGINTPKKLYDGKLAVGGEVTLNTTGYTCLMVEVNDASGDSTAGVGRAIVPVIAGARFYPMMIATTASYIRIDITNGVFTYLTCGVSDKVIRVIYGL